MRLIFKYKRNTYIIFLFMIIIFSAHTLSNVFAEPGAQDDPLVSQSYVDAKIQSLMTELTNIKQLLSSTPAQNSATVKFEKVGPVSAGKKIICGAGTELILRSGAATAVASNLGGVADLTAGFDIAMGGEVGLNHHLLVPVEDGRGITVTKEAYIMIKGTYTIK